MSKVRSRVRSRVRVRYRRIAYISKGRCIVMKLIGITIQLVINVGQRLFINLVLHRHLCIEFLPNPPIAISRFPIVRVTDR